MGQLQYPIDNSPFGDSGDNNLPRLEPLRVKVSDIKRLVGLESLTNDVLIERKKACAGLSIAEPKFDEWLHVQDIERIRATGYGLEQLVPSKLIPGGVLFASGPMLLDTLDRADMIVAFTGTTNAHPSCKQAACMASNAIANFQDPSRGLNRIVTISGGVLGIDHWALMFSRPIVNGSVAVIASDPIMGLHPYPDEIRKMVGSRLKTMAEAEMLIEDRSRLFEEMKGIGGALSVSATRNDTQGRKPFLELRDGIITALADVIIIPQAKFPSATVEGARKAKLQGKTIFAFDYFIDLPIEKGERDPTAGNEYLIREGIAHPIPVDAEHLHHSRVLGAAITAAISGGY